MPDKVPAEFEITRANTGTVFTLAFTARLYGPCYRCLGDAVLELPIRAREYQDENAGGRGDDDASTSRATCSTSRPGRATRSRSRCPSKILCRPDCAGLCAECGKNLNDEPHTHEEQHSDPRWAALEALRDDA